MGAGKAGSGRVDHRVPPRAISFACGNNGTRSEIKA